MKKLIVCLIFILLAIFTISVFATQTSRVYIHADTWDRSVNPPIFTPVASCTVSVYDYAGTTRVDSGVTNAFGVFKSTKAFGGGAAKQGNWKKVVIRKTGYATITDRHYTPTNTVDSLADTLAWFGRMLPDAGCSTVVITVRLIDATGANDAGVSVQKRMYNTPEGFLGGDGNLWFTRSSSANVEYDVENQITDAGGVAEFTTLKHAIISIHAGNLHTTVFAADSNMSLGNFRPKP